MQYEQYEELRGRLAVRGSREDYARFVESMLLIGGMPGLVNRVAFEPIQQSELFCDLLDSDSRPVLVLYSSVLHSQFMAEVQFPDRTYTIVLRLSEKGAIKWFYEFAYQNDGDVRPELPARFECDAVHKLVKALGRG